MRKYTMEVERSLALRGGSHASDVKWCRVAYRDGMPPRDVEANMGFRIVLGVKNDVF